MPDISRNAPAKINLALHVVGIRDDGYHLLDSLVCFANLSDCLTLSANQGANQLVSLYTEGEFACDLGPDKDNLVLKAAHLLAAEISHQGVHCSPVAIKLEKNLPVASGIGGGSADAAAALVLLKEYWAKDIPMDLQKIAMELGADVPMCLDTNPKRVQGIGEVMKAFRLNISLPLLLINPAVTVSTPQVFNDLANKQQPALRSVPDIDSIEKLCSFLAPLRNDLEIPAIARNPVIATVLNEIISQPLCQLARMSGSGATCFGLFDDIPSAMKAQACLKDKYPHWWCVCTSTFAGEGDGHE